MKTFNEIPIVYYHSIGPVNKEWKNNFLTLELPFFEDQLKFYKHNFDVISLQEWYQIRIGNITSPPAPLVITFDDGYLDNWVWAFPLIKKYEIPVTIFVCPELVDPRKTLRPNLDDYYEGNVSLQELKDLTGFLSWQEMKEMESSGLVDIQSHTMSHTRHFSSIKLKDFHHPGSANWYYIGNLFIHEKPFHMGRNKFETLLPYGYPVFEQGASITTQKISINPEFSEACVKTLAGYDFNSYKFETAYKEIASIYEKFVLEDKLVKSIESRWEYRARIAYEICEARKIIEEKLNKTVEFLCWPFGEHTQLAHQIAMDCGYLATTSGSKTQVSTSIDRIPPRIGIFKVNNNRLLSNLKMRYKIGIHQNKKPWTTAKKIYQLLS